MQSEGLSLMQISTQEINRQVVLDYELLLHQREIWVLDQAADRHYLNCTMLPSDFINEDYRFMLNRLNLSLEEHLHVCLGKGWVRLKCMPKIKYVDLYSFTTSTLGLQIIQLVAGQEGIPIIDYQNGLLNSFNQKKFLQAFSPINRGTHTHIFIWYLKFFQKQFWRFVCCTKGVATVTIHRWVSNHIHYQDLGDGLQKAQILGFEAAIYNDNTLHSIHQIINTLAQSQELCDSLLTIGFNTPPTELMNTYLKQCGFKNAKFIENDT